MFADINIWSELSPEAQRALLERPAVADDQAITATAARIIAAVRHDGDAALYNLNRELDGCRLNCLRVSSQELVEAESALSSASLAAIDTAITNIRRFHEAQRPADIDIFTNPGVRCERRLQALDSVGLYVPAGSAPLPSAAIMLGVPALIAKCPIRILCTPASRNGRVNAATLVAARRSGISEIYKIGGAQAIAAMAYGTATIPKVRKIFGPGNAWVTAAKRIVASDPAGASIDMPAGPSEMLIVADHTANPVFVAADLLSQAEHGEDSQVVLVTTSHSLAGEVISQLEKQLANLVRREISRSALQNSNLILADDIATAIAISNRYAPEHLLLQVAKPRELLDRIRNAGSVFLGSWTPESVGDYCSGTNHVLPTYGNARSYSGLGVEQFMRWMSVQELTKDGLQLLAPTTIELAELEGLNAHAQAVRSRLEPVAEHEVNQ